MNSAPHQIEEYGTPAWFKRAVAMPTTAHATVVQGANVRYRAWNHSDADKPPLLMIHGFLAHSHWWDFIAPFFTADFRVFALDFSGMGDSDHRPAYCISLWRDEIAAVIADIGAGPASLVAHSFGGARAIEACGAFPELVRHAVVVDSYVHFADHAQRPNRFHAVDLPRLYVKHSKAIERYRLIPPQEVSAHVQQHLAEHSVRPKPGGWGWKFDELHMPAPRDEPDSTKLLSRLSVPLSLVHGEHSRIATRSRMARVAHLIPQCNAVVEIPEANHHVMLDQPLAFVSCLRAMLFPSTT